MRNKLVWICAAALSLGLVACGSTEEEQVEAKAPKGYKVVAVTEVGDINTIYDLVDQEGCKWVLTEGFQSVSMTQKYRNGGGRAVPDCK